MEVARPRRRNNGCWTRHDTTPQPMPSQCIASHPIPSAAQRRYAADLTRCSVFPIPSQHSTAGSGPRRSLARSLAVRRLTRRGAVSTIRTTRIAVLCNNPLVPCDLCPAAATSVHLSPPHSLSLFSGSPATGRSPPASRARPRPPATSVSARWNRGSALRVFSAGVPTLAPFGSLSVRATRALVAGCRQPLAPVLVPECTPLRRISEQTAGRSAQAHAPKPWSHVGPRTLPRPLALDTVTVPDSPSRPAVTASASKPQRSPVCSGTAR